MTHSHAVIAASLLGSALLGPAHARGADEPPPLPREFRAAWVATVANIDWPSRPGLSTDDQKREATRILDAAVRLNLNAVVLQVRTSADALYDSRLEPWSAYLTGVQGRRPEPYYDPLAFWVEEAHRRGLQLHAWFNPFRARQQGVKYEESADHLGRTRPDLVKRYGGFLWLDPGEPEAAEHTLRVFLDVVKRYDVDGIHIDDYFYPYPIRDPAAPAGEARELDFPDEPSWKKYRETGGTLDRASWRRDNINRLIERVHAEIKTEKPSVLFGISPFGIPRPGQPAGVVGFDQYAKLYADAVLWLKNGWCDYFSPQLYWKIDAPGQPFRPLLDYWVAANAKGRHIWPGLYVGRIGEAAPKGFQPEEILGQIAIIRETRGATGEVHFSMKTLLRDRQGITAKLKEGPYRSPAIVPASPWLRIEGPGRPTIEVRDEGNGLALSPRGASSTPPFLWAVSVRRGASWSLSVHPGREGRIRVETQAGAPVSAIAVAAVDRTGNASEQVAVPLSASAKP